MSNQSLRQESVRAVTGTESTYEGDWQNLFDLYEMPGETYNERLLSYLNLKLSATHENLNSAMAAFALANGVSCWNELGTFDATVEP